MKPSLRKARAVVDTPGTIVDPREDEVLPMSEVAGLQSLRPRRTVSTGFSIFDDAMAGGFKEGDLIVVTGQTGHGKTSWAQTLTYNLAKGNVGTLFLSYEVLVEYVWEKFKNMGMSDSEIVYSPLKITSGGLDWLEKKVLEAINKYGIKCLVIDHLGFLLPSRVKYDNSVGSNYSAYLGSICRDLKMLAIKNNLIVILLAHTRKMSGQKRNDSPTIEDIRDSSGPAQEADFVFILQRLMPTGADATSVKKRDSQGYLDEEGMPEEQEDSGAEVIYSEKTNISLVKNRMTGQTFHRKFKMVKDLFILA